MSKIVKQSAIKMPSRTANAAIIKAAKSDPDAQPLTNAQLKAMVPMRAVRGRPKSQTSKQLLSVRYSQEVIEYFKATGDGWQARMDGVLKAYVSRHSR